MRDRQGFTLIEVALAVLAVGMGLMVIFALFPAGLQNAEDSVADTQAAMFADTVFSAMNGKAAGITNTVAWNNFATLVAVNNSPAVPVVIYDGQVNTLEFPPGNTPPTYLRYRATIGNLSPRIYSVTLMLCPGRYGVFTVQNAFYTEFVYMGM